jgi:lysophospholipase L1-like esterase
MTFNKPRKLFLIPLLFLAALLFILFFENKAKSSFPEAGDSTVSATADQHNILSGKTMVAIGDSVTEFGHYPEVIEKHTGMIVHNLGFKGTRLAYHPHSAYDEFSPTKLIDAIITRDFSEQDAAIQEDRNYSQAFIDHYQHLKTIDFNEVDIASLLIGTNDYMGNGAGVVSLGQATDSTRQTFSGALNYFVTALLDAFPHLKLVLITPTWRINHPDLGGESAATQPNAKGDYLVDFVDTIKHLGQQHELPTLDLYRNSGLNEDNHAAYFVDEVHPNEEGYERIGNAISKFLLETYNNES